jgi:hypothetical protein
MTDPTSPKSRKGAKTAIALLVGLGLVGITAAAFASESKSGGAAPPSAKQILSDLNKVLYTQQDPTMLRSAADQATYYATSGKFSKSDTASLVAAATALRARADTIEGGGTTPAPGPAPLPPNADPILAELSQILYTQQDPTMLRSAADQADNYANTGGFSADDVTKLHAAAVALRARADALSGQAPQRQPTPAPAPLPGVPQHAPVPTPAPTPMPGADSMTWGPPDWNDIGMLQQYLANTSDPAFRARLQARIDQLKTLPTPPPAPQPAPSGQPAMPSDAAIIALGQAIGADPSLQAAVFAYYTNTITPAQWSALAAAAAKQGISDQQLHLILQLDPSKAPGWAWMLAHAPQPAPAPAPAPTPAPTPAWKPPPPGLLSPTDLAELANLLVHLDPNAQGAMVRIANAIAAHQPIDPNDFARVAAVAAQLGISAELLASYLGINLPAATPLPAPGPVTPSPTPAPSPAPAPAPAPKPAPAPAPAPAPSPAPAPAPTPAPAPAPAEQPTALHSDTAEVLRIMLAQEHSGDWKQKVPVLAPWQAERGLTADQEFGTKSGIAMAHETGLIPIVRFWPKGSYREGHWLSDYRNALANIAATAEEPRRSQLHQAIAREQGQGWAPIKPITQFIAI